MPFKPHFLNQHQGSSLIEVMVSLFVLAIGLLGALALQTQSIQYNQSSYGNMQAIYIANDIAERIRANPLQDYNLAQTNLDGAAAPACAACSIADIKALDLNKLKTALDTNLKGGEISIVRSNLDAGNAPVAAFNANGPNRYIINVFFNDEKNKTARQAARGIQTYSIVVRI